MTYYDLLYILSMTEHDGFTKNSLNNDTCTYYNILVKLGSVWFSGFPKEIALSVLDLLHHVYQAIFRLHLPWGPGSLQQLGEF